MKLTFKSRNFLKELERRRTEFAGQRLAARITVPDSEDNRWWYFHEFGTATRNPDSPNPQGYEIHPKYGRSIAWTTPDGVRIVVPFVGPPFTALHPGVPPTRFITDIEENLRATVQQMAGQTLLLSQFDLEALRVALLEDIMPNVKAQIVSSMSDKLPGTREDGKLRGETASSVFESISTIQET